jgi:hypothetical protein
MAREVAWLIERFYHSSTRGEVNLFMGSPLSSQESGWSLLKIEDLRVVRFARKEDAEGAIKAIGLDPEKYVATEYIWDD